MVNTFLSFVGSVVLASHVLLSSVRKRWLACLVLLLCAGVSVAQAPERFPYQAVVRNDSNRLVMNRFVGVRVSIFSTSGNIVYCERHLTETNENGLLSIEIGGGEVLYGNFSGIPWGDDVFSLRTEYDPNGGSDYVLVIKQQLASVPYALYAKEAANGFSGDYNDLTNTPTIPTVPTNVSAFTNDAGYITGYTETDPQFNAWDKNYNDLINTPTIPTTVGELANDANYITLGQVPAQVNADWNATSGVAQILNKPELFSGDYNDLANTPVIPTVPTDVSAFSNDAGYITMDSVPTNVSAFANDAGYITGYTETDPQFNAWDKDYNDLINTPTIPTTVSELVNDANYITINQVPAQVNADWNATAGAAQILNKPELFSGDYNDLANKPVIPTVPTDVSAFTNDAGYITMDSVPTNVSAFANDAGYLAGYTETDPQFNAWDKDYNDLTNTPVIPTVPTNVSAFSNDAGYLTSYTETDPQFNAWDKDYNDLTNTPVIPTVPTNVSAFSNDAGYLTSYTETDPQFSAWDKDYDDLTNKPELFSGSYNDLTDKPTNADFGQALVRGTVNNPAGATDIAVAFTNYSLVTGGVVSIIFARDVPAGASLNINGQGSKPILWRGEGLTGGVIKANDRCLFMYNSGSDRYYLLAIDRWGMDIDALAVVARTGSYNDLVNTPTIPVDVSAFNNDAGYITMDSVPQIPTDVSYFTNDAGYITAVEAQAVVNIPTNVSAFANDAGYLTDYTETDPQFNAWNKDYNALTGKPTIPTVPTDVSAFINDAGYFSDFTEQQVLSISHDTVFLTGGSFVKLPEDFDGDYNSLTNKPTLFSGDYNDLTNTPDQCECITIADVQALIYSSIDSLQAIIDSMQQIIDSIEIVVDTAIVTPGFHCEFSTLTDYDGNTYNSVKIGEQCWMKENLRVTHYADGTEIVLGSTTSNNTPYRYYPNNDANNVATYGYLYNWAAVMHGMASSNANPSNVQGICPTGWHVPSDAEWTQLTNYVSSVPEYVCGSNNNNIAKALAATSGWNSHNGGCTVGNDQSANNTTGFSATPAGSYVSSGFVDYSLYSVMWSATERTSSQIWRRHIGHQNSGVTRDYDVKQYAFALRCLLGDGENLSTVTTSPVSNMALTSAICGGNVIYDGNSDVTARGVCWSTSPNPTVNDSHTSDGSGTGVFTSNLTGLTPNTTYYVRAYATNNTGTSYGNEVSFTTDPEIIPTWVIISGESTVCDNATTTLTATSDVAGNYTWSNGMTGQTVTVGAGIYTVTVTSGTDNTLASDPFTVFPAQSVSIDLNATANISYEWNGQTYTESGTYTQTFETVHGCDSVVTLHLTVNQIPAGDAQPCPGNETVTDYDGNVYNTVKIGEQCWMKENLKTTHYADGTEITLGNSATLSNTVPYRYCPNFDANNVASYGYLYNWVATMRGMEGTNNNPSGVQGVCPTGWHIPSNAEWTQLTDYVSSVPAYSCNGVLSSISKSLAATFGWRSSSSNCVPGNDQSLNNLTGYNAIPAGGNGGFSSGFYVWSASVISSTIAIGRDISYNQPTVVYVERTYNDTRTVRCLLGDGVNLSTVTTDAASEITSNSATCGGNVTYDGNTTVTARGVCWSTSQSPTVADAHTEDGSGTGAFTSSITGLEPNTTYYVRAYATNSAGTAYGEEVSFTTVSGIPAGDAQPCPNNPTVTDYDGNVYNTVKIGDQCWMKENLRVTHYADGVEIPLGTNACWSAYRFFPDNNPNNVPLYGYLYNWEATMRGAEASNTNPSGVQGICPTGWHVPSDAEWSQLINYTKSVPAYQCDGNYNHIAKSLAASDAWLEDTGNCTIGNDQSTNNSTGFSALPAGITGWTVFNDHPYDYSGFGDAAFFYSSNIDVHPYYMKLAHNDANVSFYPWYITDRSGLSVRCVLGEYANVSINGNHNITCSGETVTLTVSSGIIGATYTWSTGETGDSIIVGEGTYTVTVTSPSGFTEVSEPFTVEFENLWIYVWPLGDVFCEDNDSIFAIYSNSPTGIGEYRVYLGHWDSNSGEVWWENNPRYTFTVNTPIEDPFNHPIIINFSEFDLPESSIFDSHIYSVWVEYINEYGCYSGNIYSSDPVTIIPTHVEFSVISNDSYYVWNDQTYTQSGSYTQFFINELGCDSIVTLHLTLTQIPAGDAQPCPGHETVTDYDGNVYNTVKIGEQCWMKENLRVTHYADGVEIVLGSTTSNDTPYRYNPNNDANTVSSYGYLYNWAAVMRNMASSNANPSNVQGICPTGWHVPSDAEWIQLTDYVSSVPAYWCGGDNNAISKALASTDGWNSCSGECYPGDQSVYANNATGFGAVPAGYCYGTLYDLEGVRPYFWSSTANGTSCAWTRDMNNYNEYVSRYGLNQKYLGYSVRCLLGDGVNLSAVTTDAASAITSNSATCGGNVTYDGNTTVTARGVCWSTSQSPTVADAHTEDGSGTGAFTSSITGLEPNTTYYVRAYATNSAGTAYGEEVSFTTAEDYSQVICPLSISLNGSANWSNVWLDWYAPYPSSIINDTLSYHVNRIGGGTVSDNLTFIMATRYPKADLANLHGKHLTHVGAYTGTIPERARIHIYELNDDDPSSLKIVNEYIQEIPISSITQFSYNLFSLVTPILVDTSKSLLIGYEYNKVSGGAIQVGANNVQHFYNDLIYLGEWTTLPDVGVSGYAWIIDGYFGEGEFSSFDVYRDNIKINQEPVVGNRFKDSDVTSGESHCYTVVALCSTPVNSNQVCITIPDMPQSHSCPGTPTVTDYDGNIYNTVQIGSQCWLKENLRVTHFADGVALDTSDSSDSDLALYYPTPGDAAVYGLLYNLAATTRGMLSDNNPSNIQGICPTGWHVPSYPEVQQLKEYVINNGSYICGGDYSYIAKALASTDEWPNIDSLPECAVANNPSANNLTGFSFVPHGYYFGEIGGGFGTTGYSWTSSNANNSFVSAFYYDIDMSSTSFIPMHTWATAGVGLAVRCVKGNTMATVFTNSVSNVTGNTAVCGGNVTLDGGEEVTARGVCWSTSQNPTVSGDHTTDGSGTGAFTSTLSGLEQGTTYYVRAYATNSMGTVYGAVMSFTTELRCHAPTGVSVSNVTATSATISWTGTGDSYNVQYKESAIINLGGFTQVGTDQITTSTNTAYTFDLSAYAGQQGHIAIRHYNITDMYVLVVDNITLTNGSQNVLSADFESGLPEGWRLIDNDGDGRNWNVSNFLYSASYENYYGPLTPDNWVITPYVPLGGTLTLHAYGADANWASERFGVFVSTQEIVEHPWTVADNIPGNSYSLQGLVPQTEYEVQVQTECGSDGQSQWSEAATFTTLTAGGSDVVDGQPCPNNPTVTDIDGNTYNTVQIGDQCWMRENLRMTHYADGTAIPAGGDNGSETEPYYYDYSSHSLPLETRGYLYNWPAAMHGAASSGANPSGVQGICPAGWHLPSDAEWTQLTDYVGSVSEYQCGGSSSNITKALASTEGWNGSSGECYPGDQSVTVNNATGFSAVPAGNCWGSSFYSAGSGAYFWSSTQYESSSYNAWNRALYYTNAGVNRYRSSKNNGFSVRCLRD